MYVYQDLEKLGEDEKKRMDFVQSIVNKHKSSRLYKEAQDAEEYYANRNPTILKFQKLLRNAMGQLVPDIWSANYKLTHGIFRKFVLQQTQYVLSNGVSFQKEETKKTLGKSFDFELQHLTKKAMVDGVSFAFWNYDHLEVFSLVETATEPGFCPIDDGETGAMRAGVRHWMIGDGTESGRRTQRWTLYEPDGYTEYIQRHDEDMQILREKKPYTENVRTDGLGNVEISAGESYGGFPIIRMYANDLHQSELVGIRSSIDCYDFIKSGMANSIDDTSVFYWTLEGTGGMDDADLAEFVKRMKELKAVVLDRGTKAESHTLSIPVEANKLMLDYLKNDMYEDFMLLNPAQILSGNMTATAIRMAYQPQDDKCGDFEFYIRDFIGKLLALIGIDDEPSIRWNRIANQTEETQMVLMAAQYLDEETLLNKLPWLTPEEVRTVMERRSAEELEPVVIDNNPVEVFA